MPLFRSRLTVPTVSLSDYPIVLSIDCNISKTLPRDLCSFASGISASRRSYSSCIGYQCLTGLPTRHSLSHWRPSTDSPHNTSKISSLCTLLRAVSAPHHRFYASMLHLRHVHPVNFCITCSFLDLDSAIFAWTNSWRRYGRCVFWKCY